MAKIIGAIITGLVVGVLARWFYPGPVEMGWIMTILLGIAGSLLAGLALGRAHPCAPDGIGRAGCLASVLGALALILLARLIV